ncbi:MAG: competence/damage-inducible protein A [Sedimentisphaerales bacterium]|nr:competence/damage-inducible protein A [Sedimentisphaerales bacterium]
MKKACIVSIGNELLNGRTVDTNAHWLSTQLLELGIPTEEIWVVGDDIDHIVSCFKQASEVGDIILVSGGLGPTDDDLTRQALAKFLGVELEFKQDLYDGLKAFFESRKVVMASINSVQAYIPKGTKVIANPVGTAPGMHATFNGKDLFSVPGVPVEMKSMYKDYIYPLLASQKTSPVVLTERILCYGAGESTIAQQLGNRMKRGRNPLINCTVCGGQITLHVVATADDFNHARSMIVQQKQELVSILGSLVYSTEDETLPEVVGKLLRQRKMNLVTAESCTGGLIGKLLTDAAGSSDYYLGGWITYSNESKIRDLGISKELLETHGAVSEPVARAMALGAQAKASADAAIGISGIAGPGGGTEQKPVGLVYIAVVSGRDVEVREFRFSPLAREMIRQRAALTALNMLRLKLGV